LAQQFDCARIRRRESFKYLDRGGLSRAVWTEQSEALTDEDLQIESIDLPSRRRIS
jgi:hypothetical protein